MRAWRLERLLAGYHLAPAAPPLQLGSGRIAACHAWAPEGVYVGCRSGGLMLVDADGGGVLSAVATGAGSPPAAAAGEEKAAAAGAGVTSIAVNAEAVVVCSGGGAPLRWFSRGGPGQALALAGEVVGTAGA